MSDHAAVSPGDSPGAFALWVGLLTGPLAWSFQLAAGYAIEDVIACAPASGSSNLMLGMTVNAWVVLLTATALTLTIAGGMIAWRCLVRSRGAGAEDRSRWMARAGVINSVLFGVIIAIAFVPGLSLDPCRGAVA